MSDSIKFIKFIKPSGFNYKYLIAAGLISLYMIIGVYNESTVRNISNAKIDFLLIILLRQSFYTLVGFLLLLGNSIFSSQGFFKIFSTKYIKVHLLRGFLFSIGAICWSHATTLNQSSVPLYLIYYVALIIPIMSTVFSKILLNEKVSKLVMILFGLSATPVLWYLIYSKYVEQISFLLVACFVYSLLDCVNSYINCESPSNSPISFFIKYRGQESIITNNFYNALTISIFYFIWTLFKLKPEQIFSQMQVIITTPWIWSALVSMGFLYFVGFSLFLYALKFSNLSSVQPLKILEPIMAGVFFDHKSIPKKILFGLYSFLAASILSLFKFLS